MDLDLFLIEPCEIDEELYSHILCGYMAPVYERNHIGQGGDPHSSVLGDNGEQIYTYSTVSRIGYKFFFLGVLPEFKTDGEV